MFHIVKKYLPLVLLSALVTGCNSESPDTSVVAKKNPLEAIAEVTVYKSATCGCCKEWVTYLEEEGFAVTAIDHDDVDTIKAEHGLHDAKLKSCHTAIVDGYVIEGHVPANDIVRLLTERPADIIGITAPGMPMMSPGMGSRTPKDYAVLSFKEDGQAEIYSQY